MLSRDGVWVGWGPGQKEKKAQSEDSLGHPPRPQLHQGGPLGHAEECRLYPGDRRAVAGFTEGPGR